MLFSISFINGLAYNAMIVKLCCNSAIAEDFFQTLPIK